MERLITIILIVNIFANILFSCVVDYRNLNTDNLNST